MEPGPAPGGGGGSPYFATLVLQIVVLQIHLTRRARFASSGHRSHVPVPVARCTTLPSELSSQYEMSLPSFPPLFQKILFLPSTGGGAAALSPAFHVLNPSASSLAPLETA